MTSPVSREVIEGVIAGVVAFQHRLDAGTDVTDLFEPDAVFHRHPTSLEGAEAIGRFFAGRRGAGTVRHVSTNFRFEPGPDGVVVARYLVMAFHGQDGRLDQATMGDASDEWRCGEDGRWRLRSTAFVPVFRHGE